MLNPWELIVPAQFSPPPRGSERIELRTTIVAPCVIRFAPLTGAAVLVGPLKARVLLLIARPPPTPRIAVRVLVPAALFTSLTLFAMVLSSTTTTPTPAVSAPAAAPGSPPL